VKQFMFMSHPLICAAMYGTGVNERKELATEQSGPQLMLHLSVGSWATKNVVLWDPKCTGKLSEVHFFNCQIKAQDTIKGATSGQKRLTTVIRHKKDMLNLSWPIDAHTEHWLWTLMEDVQKTDCHCLNWLLFSAT